MANQNGGTLSFSQMDSLSAICDTFLPSIDANSLHYEKNMDDNVIKFLHTSASMNRTPQHVRIHKFHFYFSMFLFGKKKIVLQPSYCCNFFWKKGHKNTLE